VNPERETQTRAMAALFATAALVLVSGPRAAVQNGSGCRAGKLSGGADRAVRLGVPAHAPVGDGDAQKPYADYSCDAR
jgi:hypothetical protein